MFRFIIILLLFFFISPVFSDEYFYATVINQKMLSTSEIISQVPSAPEDAAVQKLTIHINSNKIKKTYPLYNIQLPNSPYNILAKKNDKIIVAKNKKNSSFELVDFKRSGVIYFTILIFIMLLIIIGRSKGGMALFSVFLSILLIFKVFIPLVLRGYNPLITGIIIVCISAFITIFFISGFTKKGIISILGTLGGVFSAVLLTVILGKMAYLFGNSNESILFFSQNAGKNINFQYILFAGIIIGALGAVMDVAVSIASSAIEIVSHNPNISRKKLMFSLMNIGGDIIGTMANTLILAYVGSSLPLILIISM